MAESELDRISGITKQTLRWSRESADLDRGPSRQGLLVDDVLRLFAGKIRNRSLQMIAGGDRETRDAKVWSARSARCWPTSCRTRSMQRRSKARCASKSCRHNDRSRLQRHPTQAAASARPASQKHLFEPFYSTKGDLGNGLGLYISKEIVERHGGSIRVESSGMGTTMTVFLPVG